MPSKFQNTSPVIEIRRVLKCKFSSSVILLPWKGSKFLWCCFLSVLLYPVHVNLSWQVIILYWQYKMTFFMYSSENFILNPFIIHEKTMSQHLRCESMKWYSFRLQSIINLLYYITSQSKQRGHLGRNFGYAILGLIVVSGLSSRWQHGDSLHAI